MPTEVEKQPSKLELDEYTLVWDDKKLELHVRCGRCGKFDKVNRFKQHHDGLLSFSYFCNECHWSYNIYRGSIADYKETERAIRSGKKEYAYSKITLHSIRSVSEDKN